MLDYKFLYISVNNWKHNGDASPKIISTSQGYIHKYEKLKRKVYDCNSNIYFNQKFSTRFSPLVADEERRAELVHNVLRFLRQNHFDGLDLDWEYPAFRDGGKPRDRENYALLVQVLRESLQK